MGDNRTKRKQNMAEALWEMGKKNARMLKRRCWHFWVIHCGDFCRCNFDSGFGVNGKFGLDRKPYLPARTTE